MKIKHLLCGSILFSATALASAQEAVVRIGIVAPLSGSIAHLGKDMDQGALLAIEELNSMGFVIGGHNVRFEGASEDDAADPKVAVQVANKLADSHVVAIVGHLNSGTSIVAARIYNDAGIPQIAPGASNPKLTQLGYKFVFRLMANDLQQGSGIAGFSAKTLKAKTAVVIDDRTAYGQGLADEIIQDMEKGGIKVLKREFTTDKATDFTAILTTVRGLHPDVIAYAGTDAQAGPMNKQMKQLAISSAFIGGDGLCTGTWTELSAGSNEGYYCSQTGSSLDKVKGYAEFQQRFKAKYGVDPIFLGPQAYDAVMVLATAMKAADSTDPHVFAPFIQKTELNGAGGAIRFDSHGDNPKAAVTVYQVRSGKLAPAAQ